MCGIAGIISQKRINTNNLLNMSSALYHRGPDGFGLMLYKGNMPLYIVHNEEIPANDLGTDYGVGFVHRRLSILDISNDGIQPMCDDDKHLCITYNGEIYNYKDLRKELEGLGYSFNSTCDTEVLLKGYKEWGRDCVKKLNGMWAFAIVDKRNNSVFLSRDRFGIKPLYYTVVNNDIYFASEIKSLLSVPEVVRVPNEDTVLKYLLKGRIDDSEETFFKGIYSFPASSFAVIDLNQENLRIDIERFWSISLKERNEKEEGLIERYKNLFFDSIKLHMQSDVRVGSCLSGGLDSSAIVCSADLLSKEDQLPNYSHIAFGYCALDQKYSEKQYMEEVKNHTSIDMNYIYVSDEEFLDSISDIIKSQDEPFGSASIIVQWFVFKRAKEEGIKVMLDGQGADEIMGGYHKYFLVKALEYANAKKIIKLIKFILLYKKNYGYLLGKDYLTLKIKGLFKKVGVKKIKVSDELDIKKVIKESFLKKHKIVSNPISKKKSLNSVLKNDVESEVLPVLLRHEDRNSMYHSIEARVPFLDFRLVELLFSIDSKWKIKGTDTKYILRQAMKNIIPETVISRKDKIGFKSAPKLTYNYIKLHFEELVINETEYEKLWFNEEQVRICLGNNKISVENEFLLWRIVNLKLWLRLYWSNVL